MFSHITIGAVDLPQLATFYDQVLSPLGLSQSFDSDATIGWKQHGQGAGFFLTKPFDGGAASVGNGTMVAFAAASPAIVDAVHRLALAHGGTDEGAPGLRPQYAPDYYGAYMRDPEGNKFHVVHRGTAAQA